MEIRRLEDRGLDYEIFSQIYAYFEHEPYYELWDEKAKKRIYRYYQEYGAIFCYEESGIIASIYDQRIGKYRKIVLPYENWGQVYNIGDIIVKREERAKGIGTHLLDYTLADAEEKDFDMLIARTNLENSMFESLLIKQDFIILRNNNNDIITQECNNIGRDGKRKNDTRKFLIKKLERRN